MTTETPRTVSKDETPEKSGMERHIQTVLVSLITAGVVWICVSSLQTASEVKLLNERIITLQATVEKLTDGFDKEANHNRTRIEALEHGRNTNAMGIVQLQKEVSALEIRVAKIEQRRGKD